MDWPIEKELADTQAKLAEANKRLSELDQERQRETQGHPRASAHTRYELAVALDKALSQRESVKNDLRTALNDLEITNAKVKGVDDLAIHALNSARVAKAELASLRSMNANLKENLDVLRRASVESFGRLAEILGAEASNFSMEELVARALFLSLNVKNSKEEMCIDKQIPTSHP